MTLHVSRCFTLFKDNFDYIFKEFKILHCLTKIVIISACIHEAGYKIQDVCAVTMYISDMTQFKALNEVYRKTFKYSNPPTRVCVQCPLNRNTPVLLDALAYSKKLCVAQTNVNVESNGSGDEKVTCPARITMHVQGISHWAPANIGPYSQAVQVSFYQKYYL